MKLSELQLSTIDEYIETINRHWNEKQGNYLYIDDQYKVRESDKYKPVLSFDSIRLGDEMLKKTFSDMKNNPTETNIAMVVTALDSLYHTQLKDPMRIAKKIYNLFSEEKNILDEIINIKKENDCEAQVRSELIDKITCIDKSEGTYIYSFASKFCNWLNPKAFPIFDRYVVCLLTYYMSCDKSKMGRSSFFINMYDEYIKNITDYSYKEVDQALWTYGKLLEQMLKIKDMKVSWESVSYIKNEN